MTYLNKMLTREAAEQRYGPIDLASKYWRDSTRWITMLEVPKGTFPNWHIVGTNSPVTHIACNIDIHAPLQSALDLIINRELQSQLFTFDGCFNIRPVRAGNQMSAHSYGLAIDINAGSNRLGTVPTMSPELVRCFTEQGFDWGGHFHRMDGMHFSFCWEGPRLDTNQPLTAP